MCNRLYFDPLATTTGDHYSVSTHYRADQVRFGPANPADWIYVVVEGNDGSRILTSFQWGFRPEEGNLFRAKLETASVTRAWSNSYSHNRGIVPATKFCLGNDLVESEEYFLNLAAFYDKDRKTVCVLTRPAAGEIREAGHRRMPVVIPDHLVDRWLSKDFTRPDEMKTALYAHVVHHRVIGQVQPNAA